MMSPTTTMSVYDAYSMLLAAAADRRDAIIAAAMLTRYCLPLRFLRHFHLIFAA